MGGEEKKKRKRESADVETKDKKRKRERDDIETKEKMKRKEKKESKSKDKSEANSKKDREAETEATGESNSEANKKLKNVKKKPREEKSNHKDETNSDTRRRIKDTDAEKIVSIVSGGESKPKKIKKNSSVSSKNIENEELKAEENNTKNLHTNKKEKSLNNVDLTDNDSSIKKESKKKSKEKVEIKENISKEPVIKKDKSKKQKNEKVLPESNDIVDSNNQKPIDDSVEQTEASPTIQHNIETKFTSQFPEQDTNTDEAGNVDSGYRKSFSRIDIEKDAQLIKDDRLKDNSYEFTFGDDGWGRKANDVLKHTRGKGFRHEKTKKKKGTYRGGLIDGNTVRSIKFD